MEVTNMITLDDYSQVCECEYKGEKYLARDNGAILRLSKNKTRKNDNKWTFGSEDKKTGYLLLSGARVHRVVATAFLGNPNDNDMVVDHINTNRHDNRPENLRWVTKFENAFLNPITCRKLEYITGLPVDELIKNPSILKNYSSLPKNLDWMRTVTHEESQNCYHNLLFWANESGIKPSREKGAIGEWIYRTRYLPSVQVEEQPVVHSDKKFPCLPTEAEEQTLENYQRKLKPGCVYMESKYTKYIVEETVIINDRLIVRTKDEKSDAVKPWFVSFVIFQNGKFVDELYKSCFKEEGSKEFFCELSGKEWKGEHSIDFYC